MRQYGGKGFGLLCTDDSRPLRATKCNQPSVQPPTICHMCLDTDYINSRPSAAAFWACCEGRGVYSTICFRPDERTGMCQSYYAGRGGKSKDFFQKKNKNILPLFVFILVHNFCFPFWTLGQKRSKISVSPWEIQYSSFRTPSAPPIVDFFKFLKSIKKFAIVEIKKNTVVIY